MYCCASSFKTCAIIDRQIRFAAYLDSSDGFLEDGDVVIEASGFRKKRRRKFVLTHVRRVPKLEWDYEFVVDFEFLTVTGEMKPRVHGAILEHSYARQPDLLYERGSGEYYRILGKHVDYDLRNLTQGQKVKQSRL
jgi:hypothetical protein